MVKPKFTLGNHKQEITDLFKTLNLKEKDMSKPSNPKPSGPKPGSPPPKK